MSTVDHPVTLFVEDQPWERAELLRRCSGACSIVVRPERLQDIPPAELPADAAILSTFIHSRVTGDILARLPHLKFIATRSTGFDHIDLQACAQRGILVSNVPHYGENTVAEHAFALLLALTRKIHRCYERTMRGDFSLDGLRGIDLQGRTFGALGTGRIAQHALRIARGFAMRCVAYDIRPQPALAESLGFQYVDFDTLLASADVLSLHIPHTPATHHLLNRDALAKMKRGAILINTARGGIIDPQALLDALVSGHLGGAGLDVLEGEENVGEEAEIISSDYDVETLRSLVRNHALLRLPNVIITPHVAFNSQEAVERIIATTVDNIHGFLAGKPQNLVAPGQASL